MKKKYAKPEIIIESFSLCTNIAAGCEHTNVTPSYAVQGCGYKLGRFDTEIVFAQEMGCNRHELVDDEGYYNNTVCYHVPAQDSNLFTS